MSWFRKKGKYWYFYEYINGKEKQHYVGDDDAVKERLKVVPLPNLNNEQNTKKMNKK